MRFSAAHQPRYAVYVTLERGTILVARYGSLRRAIIARDAAFEAGEHAYIDVN